MATAATKLATINKKVPAFKLDATDNLTFKLSDYKGKLIVLYFYPRDNTPGCTSQGLDFTAKHDEFIELNTEIFGISRDTVASHQKFKEKQGYTFPLLSDKDEVACGIFNVMKDKNMYGKKVRGIERSTFLIDETGKLIHEWRKVKVEGHVAEVLEYIDALYE